MKFIILLITLFTLSAHAQRGQKVHGDLTVNGKVKAVSTSKGSQPCPVMTEAQRDAVASPENGDCVFNSTSGKINIYSTTDIAWNEVSGGAGGDPGILTNGGFEKTAESWTLAAGTSSADTADKIEGKQSLSIALSAQALSLKQSSTLNASSLSGLQGLGYAYVKAPAGTELHLCAVRAGVTDALEKCAKVTATGTEFHLLKIPYVLGSTSNGIELKTSAAVTGTVKVDKAWLGAQDIKQDVNIIGAWQSYTPTVTGFGAVTSNAAKWRQVGDSIQVMGSMITGTVEASLASISLPGSYTLNAGSISLANTTAQTGPMIGSYVSHGNSQGAILTATGTSTSQVYVGYNVEAASNSLIPSNGNAIVGSNVAFDYFFTAPIANLSGSTSLYSSTNADFGWKSAGTVTFGAVTTAPTKGTVHRDEVTIKRQGDTLHMNIDYVQDVGSATVGSGAYLISLPNGLSFDLSKVSASTTLTDNSSVSDKQRVGQGTLQQTSGRVMVVDLYAYDATRMYARFGAVQDSAATTMFAIAGDVWTSTSLGFAINFGLKIKVEAPVSGWENSYVIVGSFKDIPTTQGSSGSDIQSVYFGSGTNCASACTTGACTICRQVGSKITSVTFDVTGKYRLNGIDGTKYNCGMGSAYTNTYTPPLHNLGGSTSTYALVEFVSSAAALTNAAYASVTCIGIP